MIIYIDCDPRQVVVALPEEVEKLSSLHSEKEGAPLIRCTYSRPVQNVLEIVPAVRLIPESVPLIGRTDMVKVKGVNIFRQIEELKLHRRCFQLNTPGYGISDGQVDADLLWEMLITNTSRAGSLK